MATKRENFGFAKPRKKACPVQQQVVYGARKKNSANRFKLSESQIENYTDLMKSNSIVDAIVFSAQGKPASDWKDRIIKIKLPIKIELKVIEAPPSIKGKLS